MTNTFASGPKHHDLNDPAFRAAPHHSGLWQIFVVSPFEVDGIEYTPPFLQSNDDATYSRNMFDVLPDYLDIEEDLDLDETTVGMSELPVDETMFQDSAWTFDPNREIDLDYYVETGEMRPIPAPHYNSTKWKALNEQL